LALLTDRQLRVIDHTGNPTNAVTGYRALLRYAALNPLQQMRLESLGMRSAKLTPDQGDLLRAWKPAAAVETDSRLWLLREPEGTLFHTEKTTGAPQEERVPLERGHPATGD
jgi:hypothetical protein